MKEEILKDFDEKFSIANGRKWIFAKEEADEMKQFISQSLDQYLQSYKDELVKEIEKLPFYAIHGANKYNFEGYGKGALYEGGLKYKDIIKIINK